MKKSNRIEKLTPEQEAQMAVVAAEWMAVGLDTRPANRPLAVAGAEEAYRVAGLTPPKHVFWAQSPMGMLLTLAVLKGVRAGVRAGVGDGVWAGVEAGVGDGVRAGVRDGVWAGVEAGVRDLYWNNLICGQHDAHWLAFYAYFRDVCGMTDVVAPLRGLEQVARNAGWWLPFQNVVILTERHNVVAKDSRGRLHREDGPAVQYPDGWGIYRWHGVEVPEWVVLKPQQITPQSIDEERNTEVRRVMIERYGTGRWLQDSGATLVHEDVDNLGFPVKLYHKPRHNDTPIRMIQVVNSTPEPDGSRKDYWLRVPPHFDNAIEAKAWTQHQTGEEYRRDVTQET